MSCIHDVNMWIFNKKLIFMVSNSDNLLFSLRSRQRMLIMSVYESMIDRYTMEREI